jgi:hypothetical protein
VGHSMYAIPYLYWCSFNFFPATMTCKNPMCCACNNRGSINVSGHNSTNKPTWVQKGCISLDWDGCGGTRQHHGHGQSQQVDLDFFLLKMPQCFCRTPNKRFKQL